MSTFCGARQSSSKSLSPLFNGKACLFTRPSLLRSAPKREFVRPSISPSNVTNERACATGNSLFAAASASRNFRRMNSAEHQSLQTRIS